MSHIYFAWVTINDTVFQDHFERDDEDIVNLTIEQDEGNLATAAVEIRNPRIGLLASGRLTWAWISYLDDTGHVWPIFFGRLLAIPSNLFKEVVTLQFTAQSDDYVVQKQVIADSLKVAPFYDPIFIAPDKRDDPDTILEGYSALWHVDRVTLEVTMSDMLIGEDGEEVFDEDEVPYDSVSMSMDQNPLYAIQVSSNVTWTQTVQTAGKAIEIIPKGTTIDTYTGSSLLADWPKAGQDLGGGWVASGNTCALDYYNVDIASTYTWSYSSTNDEKEHTDGDWQSASGSWSYPLTMAPMLSAELFHFEQIGLVDGFADPPINKPASYRQTLAYFPKYKINLSLSIEPHGGLGVSRHEEVVFVLRSNLQLTRTRFKNEPGTSDIESISVPGGDVGVPIINILSTFSVRNRNVEQGQVIVVPVTLSPLNAIEIYQICIHAGHTGEDEPDFSQIPGQLTTDGGATWVCIGDTPPTSLPDWTALTPFAEGALICPKQPPFITYSELYGVLLCRNWPSTVGINIAQGLIMRDESGNFWQAEIGGESGPNPPNFVPPGPITDGEAVWVFIGQLPQGNTIFFALNGGFTGETMPPFHDALDARTVDGSIVWISLGQTSDGLIDYPISDPGSDYYFPSTRGAQSVGYLVALARAHLRLRARCVKVEFECTFDRAIHLSCRKNARLYDRRFPGGTALGKITSYKLVCSGGQKIFYGQVSMACAPGEEGVVEEFDGNPVYVDDDYVNVGYQVYDGQTFFLGDSDPDCTYTLPVAQAGSSLEASLTFGNCVLENRWHGDIGDQEAAINAEIPILKETALIEEEPWTVTGPFVSLTTAIDLARVEAGLAAQGIDFAMKDHGIWFELMLKPIQDLAFSYEYSLQTTPLEVPKMIDLEAPSHP